MKKLSRTLLSLLLCLTVAMSMCLTFTEASYAAGATTVSNNSTVSATDYNGTSDIVYATPYASGLKSYTYHVNVPKGTLIIRWASDASYSYISAKGNGVSYAGKRTVDSTDTETMYYTNGGTADINISVENGVLGFALYYAPAAKTLSANTPLYFLGSAGSSAASTITVSAPAKGYLAITANDVFYPTYSTQITANGFKGWQYNGSSNGYTTYIGVNAGKYTISLKGADLYKLKVSFVKVKETSSKTSKKKAAKIKKKKANKGIVVSNAKKVHWYKIKNKKNSKMKLVFDASKISSGGSSSGKLKVTMVFPDGKKQSGTVYAGYKTTFTVKYGTIGTKKARKGTYYVKVQSQNGATGYYTMTWK